LWGIDIVRAELKEIQPPADVQETMNKVVKALNEKVAAIDFATATETNADGQRRAAIKQAEGIRQATILEAEGKAESIRLVNEAANKYFIENAQILKQLEVTQACLEKNTKIIVPSGQSVVNIIGGFGDTGSQATPSESTGTATVLKTLGMGGGNY
jgi:regulator of protease activity HflC (stomatin/prohibitin superfamily)